MSARGGSRGELALGLFLAASLVTALVAVKVAVRRVAEARVHPPAPAPAPVALLRAPAEPIRAEAEVFRTTPAMLAIEPDARRERTAHPRTLVSTRFLRAYPGAPPRIPHALTPDEFRTGSCRTCHERGGYSVRFSAYVPVTPHPERGLCVQCHVGEDAFMGIPGAELDPNARCHLCHGPEGGAPRAGASITWSTTVWPAPAPHRPDRSPPPIPHELAFRENCVTCHGGPAAAEEIRTPHPERANCRQCHVAPEAGAGEFTRLAGDIGDGSGGTP